MLQQTYTKTHTYDSCMPSLSLPSSLSLSLSLSLPSSSSPLSQPHTHTHTHSITKATFSLGLIMAYYRSQETGAAVDYTYLVVLAGIILSTIKIFTVLSRNVDPFRIPQELTWGLLTILSFPPGPPNFGSGVNINGGAGGNSKSKKQVRFSSDVKTDDHEKED